MLESESAQQCDSSGLIWVEIKQLWDCGLHDYCYNLWNILDFITNSLYLSTLALRAVAYYQVSPLLLFSPKFACKTSYFR